MHMLQQTIDKRLAKGDRMREQILMTAIQLIADGGIEELSAARLARACGISKSNVFYHYKTVDAILLAVNDLVAHMTLEAIDFDAPTLDAYLEQLLSSMMSLNVETKMLYKSFFAFYNRSLFDPQFNAKLRACTQQMQCVLAKHLFYHALSPVGVRVDIQEIELAPTDIQSLLKAVEAASKTCALSLFAFMDGLALQMLVDGQTVSDNRQESLQLLQKVFRLQIHAIKQHLHQSLL